MTPQSQAAVDTLKVIGGVVWWTFALCNQIREPADWRIMTLIVASVFLAVVLDERLGRKP